MKIVKAEIISTNGRPRLRIQLDSRQILSRQNLSRPPAPTEASPRPDPKTIDIKLGTTVYNFRYWKTRWTNKKTRRVYTAYELAPQAGRRKEKRSTLKALRERCQEIAIAMENGETARLQLTPADQASFLRSRELLAPYRKALEVVVGEHVDCLQLLNGRASVIEAVRDYLARHPAGVKPRTIPDIITEFKLRHPKRPRGKKWEKHLFFMLDKFAGRFTGHLDLVTAQEIDDWLDSLKTRRKKQIDLETRHHYRSVLIPLIDYAKSRGYVPKDFNVMDDVSDPEPPKKDTNIYTPEELVALLSKAESHRRYKNSDVCPYEKLVPFITITAFAGVRHGEMNEDKVRLLDWSDFDWETNRIYIDGKAAKGTRSKDGDDRVVDMPENLVEWLKPYVRKSGKICDVKNTANALCRLRQLAGIKGNRRNALRKSFITYRLALVKDIAAVADTAGNSPTVIKSNYKAKSHSRLDQVAERWFSIKPSRPEVLPLWQMKTGKTCPGRT